ncbi:MAG TPA: hypothetical protein VNZ01_12050 [Solirubrobacteraceae bacterium]|jgi:hypothetical protein|nr:hypothetical protein [Solirubrobacteraceae bacterium]
MSRPEPPGDPGPGAFDEAAARSGTRYATNYGHGYGRYMGLLGVLLIVALALNTALSKHNGARGIDPGSRLPPFAVPLATGDLSGSANVATHANEGAAGRVPACSVRGPQILNICQLYEAGPVVLALFVDAGSCPAVLGDLQAIAPSFPGVQFAGVSLGGDRADLRRLIRARGLSMPIGVDRDGALTGLYRDASCPQLTLAYPGGVVQSRPLLTRPSTSTLRARVAALVAASRARGWRSAAG